MASSVSRSSSRSQSQLLMFLVTALLLTLREDAVVVAESQRSSDIDALVSPYVDSYGAPTASIEVFFPRIGKVKLGKRYERNLTQDSPTVLLNGTALESGQYYSLITVDPDAPGPGVNRNESDFLHYLVTNVPGNISSLQDVKTVGQVVDPWIGPAPPIGIHRYMFLLFRQGPGIINVTPYPRSHFSVRNYTSTYNLGFPLGGTLFRVSATE